MAAWDVISEAPHSAPLSKGVLPNGQLPGREGNLDPTNAGNNWATFEVSEDGIPAHLILPTQSGDKPPNDATGFLGTAVERYRKTRQHYGAFDTDEAGANFMQRVGRQPVAHNDWDVLSETPQLDVRTLNTTAPAEARNPLPRATKPPGGYSALVNMGLDAGPKPTKVPTLAELGAKYAAMGKGALVGPPGAIRGAPGDVESLGRLALSPFGISRETTLPTTSQSEDYFAGGPAQSREEQWGRDIGSLATPFLTLKGLGLAGRGVSTLARNASTKISEVLRPNGTTAREKARAILLKNFARDPISPENAAETIRQFPDKPLAVMDVGGENTARLARKVTTLPGEGGQTINRFLESRQADQHERVLDDIHQHLADGSDVYGQIDDLMAARSQNARPLFEKANASAKPVWSPRLQEFLDAPELKEGLKRGLTIQRREALAEGVPFKPSDYSVTFDTNGDPIMSWAGKGEKDLPNLKTLQAAKEGLDAMVEQYRNPITGKLVLDKDGVALQKVQRAFTAELKTQAPPEYAQALEAWAGPSQSRDAIERGKGFLNSPPELIAKTMSRLSDADKDFYRIGAARSLQEKISASVDNADAVRKIFGTDRLRTRIDAAFGARAARGFAEAMTPERIATATNQFVRGGSNTANKLADVADAGSIGEDVAKGFIAGGPKGAVILPTINYAKGKVAEFFSRMPEDVRAELGALLTAKGPEAQNVLANLINVERFRRAKRRPAPIARMAPIPTPGVVPLMGAQTLSSLLNPSSAQNSR